MNAPRLGLVVIASGLLVGPIRGGYWGLTGGVNAGVFAVFGLNAPTFSVEGIGFRCGR